MQVIHNYHQENENKCNSENSGDSILVAIITKVIVPIAQAAIKEYIEYRKSKELPPPVVVKEIPQLHVVKELETLGVKEIKDRWW